MSGSKGGAFKSVLLMLVAVGSAIASTSVASADHPHRASRGVQLMRVNFVAIPEGVPIVPLDAQSLEAGRIDSGTYPMMLASLDVRGRSFNADSMTVDDIGAVGDTTVPAAQQSPSATAQVPRLRPDGFTSALATLALMVFFFLRRLR